MTLDPGTAVDGDYHHRRSTATPPTLNRSVSLELGEPENGRAGARDPDGATGGRRDRHQSPGP